MGVTRSDWEPAQQAIFFSQVVGAAIVFGTPPPFITAVAIATGGSITIGATPSYRVTAIDANLNETLPSIEVTGAATTTGNQTANVTWLRVPGAFGYRVYGRTAGGEQFIAQVADPGSGTTVTYSDTGAITPSGAFPGAAPRIFSGTATKIVYGIIAGTLQATASTVKIFNDARQIGTLVATPTLGTVEWPVTGNGLIVQNLWVQSSAAVDLTVLTN